MRRSTTLTADYARDPSQGAYWAAKAFDLSPELPPDEGLLDAISPANHVRHPPNVRSYDA